MLIRLQVVLTGPKLDQVPAQRLKYIIYQTALCYIILQLNLRTPGIDLYATNHRLVTIST